MRRLHLARESATSASQQSQRDTHVTLGTAQSPYVTVPEVAAFIRADRTKHPELNAWRFLKRHGIPTLKFGRRVVVYRTTLLDMLHEIDRAAGQRRRAHTAQQGLKVVRRKGA